MAENKWGTGVITLLLGLMTHLQLDPGPILKEVKVNGRTKLADKCLNHTDVALKNDM